jgi:hypothetical protein
MSAVLAGAGIGAIFGAYSKKEEIEANNKAAISAYKAQDASLTVLQGINWNRAAETTREITRASNMAIVEGKTDINKAVSHAVITRGEGVTSGISAARSVSTVLIEGNKAITKQKEDVQSKINDMWIATEDTNFNIQQQKINAHNKMKASLVTGPRAAMAIVGQAISGAQSGAAIGGMFGGPTINTTEQTFGTKSSDIDLKAYQDLWN